MNQARETNQEIDVRRIFPNPAQPRKVFKAGPLQELANSIKQLGLAQAILVVPAPMPDKSGDGFMVVAGERRWRATCLAGLATIPTVVRWDLDENGVRQLALMENLIREDLNHMEEAKAYDSMLQNGYTIPTLTQMLGFQSEERVKERLALMDLAPEYQEMLSMGILTPVQARQMAYLSHEGQRTTWGAIKGGKCQTVAQLKRMVVAIYDDEHQVRMFKGSDLSETEKVSLSRVDQFIKGVDSLIGVITDDDLKLIRVSLKSDAPVCLERLRLLASVIQRLQLALETGMAKANLGVAA